MREAVRDIPGLDVLDERLAGAPRGVRLRPAAPAIDVRGTEASGFELARLVREQDDVFLELAGENVMVAVFGMGEDAEESSKRLLSALRRAVDTVNSRPRDAEQEPFAPPPPWGELVMTPRDAFPGTAGDRARRRSGRAGGLRSRWPPIRRGSRTFSRVNA